MISSNPKVSICIPVYEMHGMGVRFLRDLLTSIRKQSYSNIEVVISDHSNNNQIESFIHEIFDDFVKRRTSLLYYRLYDKRGNSSANMNNAIIHATGQIIKPMFQDDFFCNNECVFEIVKAMNENPNLSWGGVGFIHADENITKYYGDQIPYDNHQLLAGNNTFGCPTVAFFKKSDVMFDEKLIWLMDCEYYHSLRNRFGKPLIVNKTGVAIRVWSQSVSREVPEHVKASEERYVLEKHNHTRESLDQIAI